MNYEGKKREKVLHAAIRFYAEKADVKITCTNDIIAFDEKKSIPYDAYVKSGYNERNNAVYEPAAVLGLSNDKQELLSRKKRWLKPNKRRSDVIHELATKNIKPRVEESGSETDTSKATVCNKKVPNLIVPIEIAERIMQEKTACTSSTALRFNLEVEKPQDLQSTVETLKLKDNIIAKLRKELEDERKKNSAYMASSSTSNISSVSNPFCEVGPSEPHQIFENRALSISPNRPSTSRQSLSAVHLKQRIQEDQSSDVQNKSTPQKKQNTKSKKWYLIQKSKYKRKLQPCVYDTDDYNQSDSENKKEKLTSWYRDERDEITGNMIKTKMFHLHYGISVPYRNWKKAKAAKSSYGFSRELVPYIWKEEQFIKKAVQLKKTIDRDKREPITPKKFNALKKVWIQFLYERNIIFHEIKSKTQEKERKTTINKFGRDLRIIISQTRCAVMKNASMNLIQKKDDKSSESSLDEVAHESVSVDFEESDN